MKLDLTVSRKQREFIEADADEVFYGGAAGGGKSFAQVIDALLYALQYPGSRQLILRRSFPELSRSIILVSQANYPRRLAKYNSTGRVWKFQSGSMIEFGYCDSEADVTQYQSAEYDVIRFDELTHFTEFQYVYMLSRIRGVNDFPKSIRSTGNPGGVGHAWVKARFIDPRPEGVKGTLPSGRSVLYIPAKVTDNPFLMKSDPGYIKRLEELPEAQRRALLDGDWNIFEGQYFTGWDPEIHVVKPFPIPDYWRRYLSIDYGRDMLAALWTAFDPQGRGVVYREFCSGLDGAFFNKGGKTCGALPLLARDAAREILRENAGEKLSGAFAPPDLWNKHADTGQSTAEVMAGEGLSLVRADNRRDQGWMAVADALRMETDEQGCPVPGLRVFENCRVLIASLPQLQYDLKNPDDCAAEPHEITHAPDALRYLLAGRPARARIPEPENPFEPERSGDEALAMFGI